MMTQPEAVGLLQEKWRFRNASPLLVTYLGATKRTGSLGKKFQFSQIRSPSFPKIISCKMPELLRKLMTSSSNTQRVTSTSRQSRVWERYSCENLKNISFFGTKCSLFFENMKNFKHSLKYINISTIKGDTVVREIYKSS